MTRFASKMLVYLAAVMLPVQPLSVMSCGCDAHSDANIGRQHIEGIASCCDAKAPGGRSSHSPASPCCTKAHESPSQSCCCNEGACTCRCDHSPSPTPQVPSEGRSPSANESAQSLLSVLIDFGNGHLSVGLASIEQPNVASGIERCVMLCRFQL